MKPSIKNKIFNFLKNQKSIIFSIAFILTAVYIGLIVFQNLEVFNFKEFIRPTLLFLTILLTDTIAICLYTDSLPTKKQEGASHFFGYIFFILILLLFLSQIKLPVGVGFLSFFNKNSTIFQFIGIAVGFIFMFLKREEINKFHDDKHDENNKDQNDNQGQVHETISTQSNRLKKKSNKKWLYILAIILLMVIGAGLRLYNLDYHDFWEDEYQVVEAATSYHYTGTFYKWDWIENKSGEFTGCIKNDIYCNYTRAWPHTILIALSYNFLGVSEWSSRIVSVIFGVLLIPIGYLAGSYFTKKRMIGLVTAFAFTFYPSYIDLSRYTRMYALLIPIFLLTAYFFYKGIVEPNKIKFKPKGLNNFINKYLNFNFPYLILALAFLYLNYKLHINSLVILPVLFLFIIYMTITNKEWKYRVVLILGAIGMVTFILLVYYFSTISFYQGLVNFFGVKNLSYLGYLTQYSFFMPIGIIFLLLSILSIFFIRNKYIKNKLVYLSLFVIFSLIFFIYIANIYSGFVYISHITTISIILITYFFILLINLNKKLKIIPILLIIILLFSISYSFYNTKDKVYYKNDVGKFSNSYKVIIKNYNPEENVVFGQYLKTYYLKDLPSPINTISMKNNRLYTFEEFMNDLKKYDSGWITWETRKVGHIRSDITSYICRNFRHVAGQACGEKIDNNKVEIFYFDKSMIK